MALPTLAAAAATALGAAGLALAAKPRALARAAGFSAVAAAAWLDWRAMPLAVLAWSVHPGEARRNGRAILLLGAVGLLCAMNTAIGRASLYSLQAIRHHYVSGFVTLALVGALLRGTPRRRAAFAALAFLAAANAWAAMRFVRDYRRTNEPVLSFHRELGRLDAGRRVFVPSSTSLIRSPDWSGQIGQDWVFDILHARTAPLTRHVGRADFVYAGGRFVENPLRGPPDSEDFRVDFRLSTEESRLRFDAKKAFALLGRRPGEPRLEILPDGFRLVVTRCADGTERSYDFPLPVGTNRFFYETKTVSLVRTGSVLSLEAGGASAGRHEIAGEDAYFPWTSDGTALLGRDAEILLAKLVLFDTYVRIGPAVPGLVP